MKKRIAGFLILIMLICMIPANAFAASLPSSFKAPSSLSASEWEYCTKLNFVAGSDLSRFNELSEDETEALGISAINVYSQIDWKLNDGKWHYTADWDTLEKDYPWNAAVYVREGVEYGMVTPVPVLDLRDDYSPIQKELGSAMIKGASDTENRLDLKNNTFYFRVRLIAQYYDEENSEYKTILSPWSETLAYGKSAVTVKKPAKLEPPVISDAKTGKNSDGSPNFTFTVLNPQQIKDAQSYYYSAGSDAIAADYEININNAGWISAAGGWTGNEKETISMPVSYTGSSTANIAEAYVQIRMRYKSSDLVSPWSNITSINTPAWSNASTWATAELQKAEDLGLIPGILKGADMTKPITREEFCELAVLLYEKSTGTAASAAAANPFTDTSNPQILKAFSLGVTTGTSGTTFSPKVLINREQCAAMLFRAIKAIDPNGDYSVAGIKDFPDQKHISSWAGEATKYMSKKGIIKGDNNGNFMPKATTSAQEAAGYGMATREAAILMNVRTYTDLL